MKIYVTTEAKLNELWVLEQHRMSANWGGSIDTHDVDAILTEVDTTALHDAFRGARNEPTKSFAIVQAYAQAQQDICKLAEG